MRLSVASALSESSAWRLIHSDRHWAARAPLVPTLQSARARALRSRSSMKTAAERGLPLLRVAVNSENDAADQLVQLYEHIGYKVDGLACLRAQTKYIYLSKKVRVGARE